MENISIEIMKSWADRKGSVTSNEDILQWIRNRSASLKVNVEQIDFSYSGFWFYDEETGYIRNQSSSFFQLAGYQEIEDDLIVAEQPVIIQDEIGYLGIICKMMNGTLHFLMQAKIEPGNVNVIQISPTLQATKSNFYRKHGGKAPSYLEYFLGARNHRIIVDQVQSEQSSRFYKKRNRNIIILVDGDVPVLDSHKWMTLGQIKELMRIDNLVNMDTRTVISCLPLQMPEDGKEAEEIRALIGDEAFFRSVFSRPDYGAIRQAFNLINDYKMFRREKSRLLPLKSLKGWQMTKREIRCRTPYDFKVIYCRIEIEDREVKYWEQPLIQAMGQAVFGVFTCVRDGRRKYLVRVKHEIGCFDGAELGPMIQLEPSNARNMISGPEKLFLEKLEKNEGVVLSVVQSEEGGRFYHEENRNAVIEIGEDELGELPEGYLWMDYATISEMIQFNNCVNIQLRNLISLLDLPGAGRK